MAANILKYLSAFVYRQKKREVCRQTGKFARQQYVSSDALQEKSDTLALDLLRHAYQYVPYYRNIMKAQGLDPAHFTFPDDWQRLPLLAKPELIVHFEEIQCGNACVRKSYLNHTGGSTGVPVNFLTDVIQAQRMTAWLDLVYSWAGWKPGEIRLELWGNKEQRIPLTFWDKVRASLSGHFILPVYEYSENTMHQWWMVIEQLRPTIIYGYPSVLSDFAKWLEADRKQPLGIKGVFSSAEVLYPEQRSIIEKVFLCKVFNQYGSREAPCIACECTEGGMHIFSDFNRIEFIHTDDCVDNQEIIVTPLYNYAQPLIRYRLGDLGRPLATSCGCGRGYPLMELNVARSRDVIKSPNGVSFYPGFFTRLMDGQEGVRAFQFVQKRLDHIELNIVLSGVQDPEHYCAELSVAITPLLVEKMGNLQFHVNSVEKIDRTSAGKHRYVISEIKNEA